MKKPYEKPRAVYKSMVSSEAVASGGTGRCWAGPQNDNFTGWYNDPGFGGVNFQMGSYEAGNCSDTLHILGFCDNDGLPCTLDFYLSQHPEYSRDTYEGMIHDEIVHLAQTGNNNGQNFQGDPEEIVITPPPGYPWSK